MSQVVDQVRHRRAYLRRKLRAYTGVSYQLLQLGTLLFTAAMGVVATLLGVIKILNAPFVSPGVVITTVGVALFTCLSVSMCLYRLYRLKRAVQDTAGIPYIPPVSADTLPSAEVLVRAAHEPQHEQQKVLLRAAAAVTQTPQEQLLRPTDVA
jgi:hypothetical protein